MFEYLTDNLRLIDKADDLHLSCTVRTLQWINLPYFFYTLPPGRRRDLTRLVTGDINNFNFVVRVFAFLFRSLLFGPFSPYPV